MKNYTQKQNATRADLHFFGDYVFCVGYCDAASILSGTDARFYNHGLYGWNWDGYTLYASNGARVIICTGYRNTTGTPAPRDLVKKYNKRADAIRENETLKYKFAEQQKRLEKNRVRFADALVKSLEG